MVSFLSGVLDGLDYLLMGLLRALYLQSDQIKVILVVLNFDDGLKTLLEVIFKSSIKAAVVLV